MKKKSRKRTSGESARREQEPEKPPPVGGRERSADRQWARVGRKPSVVEDDVTRIASALKAEREAQGISVAHLARELDVAPATLIKFEERGHGVSIRVVARFAEALSCQLKVSVPTAKKRKPRKR